MLKYVPNALTILRFLLIPLIILFVLTGHYILAILILTLSGITDVLDGYIARKYNFITDFGKLMDPLADKATQLATLASLTINGILDSWIIYVVIIKEFVMIAGASFLYGKELVVSSKWYGKLATVLFYVAIVCTMFINYWNLHIASLYDFEIFSFDKYIYYLAIISTVFSLIMYIKAFWLKGYLKDKGKNIS